LFKNARTTAEVLRVSGIREAGGAVVKRRGEEMEWKRGSKKESS
jgi:hypothetical protein